MAANAQDQQPDFHPCVRKAAAVLARNATARRVDTIRAVFETAPVGPAGAAERRAAAQLLLMLQADSHRAGGTAAEPSTTATPEFPNSDEELARALAAHHRRVAREQAQLRDAYADRVVVAGAVALGVTQLAPAIEATNSARTVPSTSISSAVIYNPLFNFSIAASCSCSDTSRIPYVTI